MNQVYGRDLDLNLLRVFVVVADSGSVTAAAARLYLTQPAVSAALKRLATAVGASLFARRGRGLVLSARGERLLAHARPHLDALVAAALAPPVFEPATSTAVVRLGLSDSVEGWLLPRLLRALERRAPKLRLVVLPVQFRTVVRAFESERADIAVTVADEAPAGVRRQPLFRGWFVALSDARHAKLGKKPSLERYLEHEHVVVSYNGDLRGVVEDFLGIERRVRCSVATLASLGEILEGTALVATVPSMVGRTLTARYRHLRAVPVPFGLTGATIELLWSAASDDDPACTFVRDRIVELSASVPSGA
jgi:LysR family transcriptional activator of mexEF-oprN operon